MITAILAVVIIVISSVLHELAHGFVAYKLGDDTAKEAGRLTLNPIKHIDPYLSIIVPAILSILGMPIIGGAKPVPVNRKNLKGGAWGMALVALAGPLTNILIAFAMLVIGVATGAVMVSGIGNEALVAQTLPAMIVMYFVYINVILAVFNLLPIPPLDGSRVLYALAPDGVRDFLDKIEPYSLMIAFGVVIVFNGVFSGVISSLYSGVFEFFISVIKLVI